ncbi:MAG: Uma2 family endonuclease [Acidobacteria bacterium]|nr:Uma2 family endonuclease [Acidobacteriota bacterium]
MSQRLANNPIWTYADYCVLPQDYRRHEIVEGEHIVTPSPTARHQKVLAALQFLLDSHVRSQKLGTLLAAPMDVVLSETSVIQPDLLFVSTLREHIITEPYVDGPPDLVIEVLSASTASMDRGGKMRLYAKYRIPHYWIVDAKEVTLETFELREAEYQLQAKFDKTETAVSKLFPGLQIPMAELGK